MAILIPLTIWGFSLENQVIAFVAILALSILKIYADRTFTTNAHQVMESFTANLVESFRSNDKAESKEIENKLGKLRSLEEIEDSLSKGFPHFKPLLEFIASDDWHQSSERTRGTGPELQVEEIPSEVLSLSGRPRELRWTDLQLEVGDQDSLALRWGIAPAGKITAVTSALPSQKSALVSALLDPWNLSIGRVFLETSKETFRIDQLNRSQWLNEIGLIGTTPTFARGTIEANLKLIKARATRDRLQKLLEDLGLDQTLLPEGIKTTLSFENSLFSYSIQRRLALARVILKDPLIILCEEPSQSGDEETEMLIQQNLRSLAESGKLVIYFTSSDSAAQISKRILDLDAITPTLAPRVSA